MEQRMRFGLVRDWAVKYATFEGIFLCVFMGNKGNKVLEIVKVSEVIEKWAEKTKIGAFLEDQLAHLAHEQMNLYVD